MRIFIKMKRRIMSKIDRSLYAFTVLLLSVLSQDQRFSSRQVNGNILSSQQINNITLPALTERANVNSRHLSAASTASLAAATMAASNGIPSSAQSTTINNNNNNNQDPSRNFYSHQQQQHQQQQQQQQTLSQSQQQVAPVAVNNNQVSNQAQQLQNQAQSQSPIVQAASIPAQFTSGVVQSQPTTPSISTTYTFNPLTGQYQQTDISTGLLLNQYLQNNPQPPPPINSNNNSPLNPIQLPFGFNNIPQQQSFSYRPGSYQQQQQQNLPGNMNQFINQQRQVSQFSRRTGYGQSNSRLNTNIFGQPPDDDGGFVQQQPIANTLIGELDLNNGYNVNSNYITGANQFLNGPNQGHQQTFADHNPSIAPLPSSLTPIVQTPTSSVQSSFIVGADRDTGSSYNANHRGNDQCVAADNRHGTCYQASECIRRGGTPMGKCGGSSSEITGSSYVCCLFDVTCGQFAAERFVYFRNPNYPNTFDQSRMCRAKIGKLDKGVCQFRLDLLRFDVAKPTNGNCSNDMFVVSGQNENYVIPKICGLNDGQHYYVGVDESGVITLHMMMMGYYRRSFEIMITQIPCRSDYAAPAHCLQYYMGTHGTIKSFNYDDEQFIGLQQTSYDLLPQANQLDGSSFVSASGVPMAPYGLQFNQLQQQQQQRYPYASPAASAAALVGQNGRFANIYQNSNNNNNNNGPATTADLFGGYPNDLDYTMCIRKESGFCSITYQLSRGEQGLQPFAVGYQQYNNNNNFGLANSDNLTGSGSNWHPYPVSTECRDDYLLIGGVRLCSGTGQASFGNLAGGFDQATAVQFGQNGTNNHHQQQQQLQAQQNLLLQQLARLQQQQAASGSNVSYANNINGNNNSAAGQQTGNGIGSNLDQQQASLMQQLILVQQQLGQLAANGQQSQFKHQSANLLSASQYPSSYPSDLQGAIITDTTSGPFLLRFVSNLARNARGFHIDYRQNPCK